jgi:predicted GNAT family acetyltransferase
VYDASSDLQVETPLSVTKYSTLFPTVLVTTVVTLPAYRTHGFAGSHFVGHLAIVCGRGKKRVLYSSMYR